MPTSVPTFYISGLRAAPAYVEVDLLQRLPSTVIVGLPGHAVRDVADVARSSIEVLRDDELGGEGYPRKRVVVNVSPLGEAKPAAGFELPIAVAIMAEAAHVPADRLETTVFVGRLDISGNLCQVNGACAIARAAKATGHRRIVVPLANVPECIHLQDGDFNVMGMADLQEVVRWLKYGEARLRTYATYDSSVGAPDMADVRGCAQAVRALEVAAVGRHGVLLRGPEGSGKTALAARAATLCTLDEDAVEDLTTTYSCAGLLSGGRVTRAPFRAPHHTVSLAGLLGSLQAGCVRPGEVMLAHHGVLFLDEIENFGLSALDSLGRALDHGTARVGPHDMPAQPWLLASMALCPCGAAGHPTRECSCTPEARSAGVRVPLRSHLPIQVTLQPTRSRDLPAAESSATIRARVTAARAFLQSHELELSAAGRVQLALVADRDREMVRSVARSIAALAASEEIRSEHVSEATMLCLGAF